jgi:hypothetical protein
MTEELKKIDYKDDAERFALLVDAVALLTGKIIQRLMEVEPSLLPLMKADSDDVYTPGTDEGQFLVTCINYTDGVLKMLGVDDEDDSNDEGNSD